MRKWSRLPGRRVKSTVPVSFIHEADEIEIVDAPAEMISETAQRPPGRWPLTSTEVAGAP